MSYLKREIGELVFHLKDINLSKRFIIWISFYTWYIDALSQQWKYVTLNWLPWSRGLQWSHIWVTATAHLYVPPKGTGFQETLRRQVSDISQSKSNLTEDVAKSRASGKLCCKEFGSCVGLETAQFTCLVTEMLSSFLLGEGQGTELEHAQRGHGHGWDCRHLFFSADFCPETPACFLLWDVLRRVTAGQGMKDR